MCRPPFWEHFLFEFVAAYLARWSISRRPRVNPWLAIMESEQCFWKPIRDWHLARRNLQKLQVVEGQKAAAGRSVFEEQAVRDIGTRRRYFWKRGTLERRILSWGFTQDRATSHNSKHPAEEETFRFGYYGFYVRFHSSYFSYLILCDF